MTSAWLVAAGKAGSGSAIMLAHDFGGANSLRVHLLARDEALAELVKPDTFEILPGAGHLPQLERPEAVLKAIGRFLPRQ